MSWLFGIFVIFGMVWVGLWIIATMFELLSDKWENGGWIVILGYVVLLYAYYLYLKP